MANTKKLVKGIRGENKNRFIGVIIIIVVVMHTNH